MAYLPKFISPAHPEASGVWSDLTSLKRMLHHAITSHLQQWHKSVQTISRAICESGYEAIGLLP
jgi:hypothetical protein